MKRGWEKRPSRWVSEATYGEYTKSYRALENTPKTKLDTGLRRVSLIGSDSIQVPRACVILM